MAPGLSVITSVIQGHSFILFRFTNGLLYFWRI